MKTGFDTLLACDLSRQTEGNRLRLVNSESLGVSRVVGRLAIKVFGVRGGGYGFHQHVIGKLDIDYVAQ